MPTPFTHLEYAQRFLADSRLSADYRQLLEAEKSAFLLGNIAADARVGSGAPRHTTHFYAYGSNIHQHPWRLMLEENSELRYPRDSAHRAFVAGYVAHLSVDEYWSKHMVKVHFWERNWAEQYRRFLILHVILIHMDQRDFALLDDWQAAALHSASPDHWLKFMSDTDLIVWRDLIYEQIKPEGQSQTYEIFGERTGVGAEILRELMATEEDMHENLWQYIPRKILASIENEMYDFAFEQMLIYLSETASFDGDRTR